LSGCADAGAEISEKTDINIDGGLHQAEYNEISTAPVGERLFVDDPISAPGAQRSQKCRT